MSKEKTEGSHGLSKVILLSLGLCLLSPQPPREIGCGGEAEDGLHVREEQLHTLSCPLALLGTHLALPSSYGAFYPPELGNLLGGDFPSLVPHPTG